MPGGRLEDSDALREVIQRGFGQGDMSVADRFAGPPIIEHEYAALQLNSGAETLRAMIDEARSSVPGLNMTVEGLVVDGDKVWAGSIGRAPNPAGGQDLVLTVFDVCRFEDGRIVEHW